MTYSLRHIYRGLTLLSLLPRELLRSYFKYVFAFILTALSVELGNILDGVMVGQIIGPDAVAAVGTTLSLLQGYYSVYVLLGGGGGMLVGLAIGKGRRDEASSIFSVAVVAVLGLSILLSIAGLVATDPIAAQFCTNTQLQPLATSYMRWMLLAAPVYFGFFLVQTFVAVDGEPGLVTAAVTTDGVVNVGVSVLLMKFTPLGVAGAAIGTVVGHAVAGLLLVALHWRPRRDRAVLGFRFSAVSKTEQSNNPNNRTILRIISQGAPLAISSFCTTAQYFFCNRIVMNALGKDGMFVYAVSLNVLPVFQLFIGGASQTMQTLGSVEKGKGGDGFAQIVRLSYWFLCVALSLVGIAFCCRPELVVRLFGGGDRPELIPAAASALRLFAPSFVLLALLYIHMVVQKLRGRNAESMFISLTLMLMPVPAMWVLARFAAEWIWWGYLLGNAVEIVLIGLFEFSERSRK